MDLEEDWSPNEKAIDEDAPMIYGLEFVTNIKFNH
jgi:hypothetical protein